MLLSKRMHEKGAAFCAAAIPFGGTLGSHRSDARGSCMTPWIFSQKHDQQLPARRIADNLLSVLLLAVEGGSLWAEAEESTGVCASGSVWTGLQLSAGSVLQLPQSCPLDPRLCK